MINQEEARNIAQTALATEISGSEPSISSWPGMAIGDPVVVHDLNSQPIYWIVPFVAEQHVVGFARILANGDTFAIGSFCPKADSPEDCPQFVTGISKQEAQNKVSRQAQLNNNESIEDPIFVFDGPLGREAWLLVINKDNKPIRWVFVTLGGIYERPAGALLNGINE